MPKSQNNSIENLSTPNDLSKNDSDLDSKTFSASNEISEADEVIIPEFLFREESPLPPVSDPSELINSSERNEPTESNPPESPISSAGSSTILEVGVEPNHSLNAETADFIVEIDEILNEHISEPDVRSFFMHVKAIAQNGFKKEELLDTFLNFLESTSICVAKYTMPNFNLWKPEGLYFYYYDIVYLSMKPLVEKYLDNEKHNLTKYAQKVLATSIYLSVGCNILMQLVHTYETTYETYEHDGGFELFKEIYFKGTNFWSTMAQGMEMVNLIATICAEKESLGVQVINNITGVLSPGLNLMTYGVLTRNLITNQGLTNSLKTILEAVLPAAFSSIVDSTRGAFSIVKKITNLITAYWNRPQEINENTPLLNNDSVPSNNQQRLLANHRKQNLQRQQQNLAQQAQLSPENTSVNDDLVEVHSIK
ncbi:hypothetical protein [Spiroplasma sp. DGKH1]|uniref:hypothetical protein n=1 Tax=Spiroplasma sp. DGKH1 TaxID=3050074 RepID=UPI0034C5D3C9